MTYMRTPFCRCDTIDETYLLWLYAHIRDLPIIDDMYDKNYHRYLLVEIGHHDLLRSRPPNDR